jgi:hypothetical protein
MPRTTTRKHRMIRALAAGLALAIGLSGATAQAERGPAFRPVFVARNDLLVYPMPDGTFEVQARAGTAGPQYFCAAGDYAWRRLNVPVASRVVVVRPDGPSTTNPGGRGMVFKVVPQGAASSEDQGWTVSMRRAGENHSVAMARALCRNGTVSFGIY